MVWTIASIPFWLAGLIMFGGCIVGIVRGIQKKDGGAKATEAIVALLFTGAVLYIAARIAS